VRDARKSEKDRRALIENLRTIEADVLLESGDTLDNGYLYFGQGGQKHLVVEESRTLYALVERLANVTKRESANINELLVSALTTELKKWE